MALVLLLSLHVLSVWVFPYFPTQDGSSHVYNAAVLAEYHEPENYRLRDVYRLNLGLFPNWSAHGLLAFLLRVCPPTVAERILVSLCVGLLPLSLLYFLRAVNRSNTLPALVGFTLTHHYLLKLGFYSFSLSVPVVFFTLGYWWNKRHDLRVGRVLVLLVLLFSTYLCHGQSFLLSVLILTLLSGWDACARRRIKPALVFACAMTPIYALALHSYVTMAAGAFKRHLRLSELLEYFLSFGSIVSYRAEHAYVGFALLALLLALALGSIVRRVREAGRAGIARALDGTEPFLVFSVLLTVLYFVSPWSVGSGRWVNDRIHLFVFPVLLPFLRLDRLRGAIRYGTAGALVVLSLVQLGLATHTNHNLAREVAEMVRGVGVLQPHTTVGLAHPSRTGPEQRTSDHLGRIEHVSPFLYVATYAMLESRDVAFLANYEASLPYFPVNYRESWAEGRSSVASILPDYVLAWRLDEKELAATDAALAPDYELVREARHSRLYGRRTPAPDPALWSGSGVLRLDLQPVGARTAPGSIPVLPGTFYEAGRFGWLSLAPRTASTTGDDPLAGDAIGGHEGGIFRLDLPDGRYRLSADTGPTDRVLANDEVVEGSHVLLVEDRRLTVVFSSESGGAGWTCRSVEVARVE